MKESQVHRQRMFPAHDQAAVVAEPGEGAQNTLCKMMLIAAKSGVSPTSTARIMPMTAPSVPQFVAGDNCGPCGNATNGACWISAGNSRAAADVAIAGDGCVEVQGAVLKSCRKRAFGTSNRILTRTSWKGREEQI